MTLRLRQVCFAAAELEPVATTLRRVLRLGEPWADPGVAEFGLHNAVMPLGTSFLEVVAPTRDGTAAGRLLQRRGDCGYMLIFQTDDLARDRARLARLGVREVWRAAFDDIEAVHLHPKDVGGAITSLDQPRPPASWRWGGPGWEDRADRGGATRCVGAELEADDPQAMARRWAEVFGLGAPAQAADGAWRLALDGAELRFVRAGARGPGIAALRIATPDAAATRARAVKHGDGLTLCGCRIELVEEA